MFSVAGASSDPASNNFAGPEPFSEPESRTLSEFIRSIGDIEMYISFHAAGQILLIPFGNTTEPLANYHDAVCGILSQINLVLNKNNCDLSMTMF